MLTFIRIPTVGDPTVLTCEPEDVYTTIRDGVGGLLEAVGLEDAYTLYLHEEGKLIGLPVNETATQLTRGVLSMWDIVVGDCVIVGPPDDEGAETSVSDEWLARFGLTPASAI
jgi:hypothetical protein